MLQLISGIVLILGGAAWSLLVWLGFELIKSNGVDHPELSWYISMGIGLAAIAGGIALLATR